MKISFRWKYRGYRGPLAKSKGLLWGVRPFLIVLLLFLIVRFCLFSLIVLPNNQRAIVSLVSYGLRLPGETLWGYYRWGYSAPQKGDEVVFTVASGTSHETIVSGKCVALPGENVWIDPVEQRFLPGKTSPDAQPICIPSQGKSVKITPFNVRLLAYLMSHFEASKHIKITSQSLLQLKEQTLNNVRLLNDYYWIEILPNSFVMVPHSALVGKVVKKF